MSAIKQHPEHVEAARELELQALPRIEVTRDGFKIKARKAGWFGEIIDSFLSTLWPENATKLAEQKRIDLGPAGIPKCHVQVGGELVKVKEDAEQFRAEYEKHLKR